MKENTEVTRIAVLETNQNNIMEKLDSIVDRFNKFEEKLDKALEKKADKDTQWAEPVLKSLGIFLASGILAYIGSILIKTIEK